MIFQKSPDNYIDTEGNQVLTAADIKKRDFIKERINLLY